MRCSIETIETPPPRLALSRSATLPTASREEGNSRRDHRLPTVRASGTTFYRAKLRRAGGRVDQLDDPVRRDRRLGDAHAERLERVLDRRKERRDRRDGAALARPLEPERIERARRLHVQDFHVERVSRKRQKVFAEIGRLRLRPLVVEHALEERVADAVDDAAD